MKGIVLEAAGASLKLDENVTKPVPGKGQVLVKSLVTAINPVDTYMQGNGMLVTEFPVVIGCDASGVVVEVGEGVTKFKVGDAIFGCTVLGTPGHSSFQEYHLMYAHLSFKKPDNITTEEAATIGVGLLTSGLGLIIGTKLDLKPAPVTSDSPWILILGAAGSVGQYGIQYTGHKVLASCSPSNDELVKSIGADASFDYRLSPEEQLSKVEQVTGGNWLRIYDVSSMGGQVALAAIAQNKSNEIKYFATTNDWDEIEPREGLESYLISLGELGRSGNPRTEQINVDLAKLVEIFEPLLGKGELKPNEYVKVGDTGVGEILKAWDAFKTHKSGKKLVVRVADN